MPLKLVTGPANAAKAGEVLGALRERVDEDPVLVVPAFEDVEHHQRELAARGVVFGVRVLRFRALFGLIAARAGLAARPASDLQRRLIVEEAVRKARFEVLRSSAARPGFAAAAARFMAELGQSRVEPARLTQALRAWAQDGPRRRYAEEIAELYRRYREGLEAAGLLDEDLFAWRALDAVRLRPQAWGGNPVYVYGFDDFTPLEMDALETLAHKVGVEVTVSLPYEAGREAFRAIASVREDLAALASEVVALEAVSDHYADESRTALHALERGLFEAGEGASASGGAVWLHTAGGERAELELCAAEVLRLLRSGTPPGEVAVVFRDPRRYASLVEQVFGAYGIPYSIDHSVPLSHTGLGAGVLALLRCALLEGSAEDLLTYLRTPGLLRESALADRLEADVRRHGATTAVEAREIWEATPGRWPLEDLDGLASARGSAALLAALDRRLERLFAGPHRRRAPILAGAELDDPRVFNAAHEAISELHALVRADPSIRLDARAMHQVLEALPVRLGELSQPDRVQVASPLAVRARRFSAVFMCGLQEREFPRGAASDAFLPDADRRDMAKASGLALPLWEDQVERERYLFYAAASRAERLLVLSSRYCDEDGDHEGRSFFVEDALAVFTDMDGHERRRALSDVTWSVEDAPTEAEWERALARRGGRRPVAPVGPLTAPPALAELAGREVVSAGGLERFASCPVKWLVEDVLDPERLEPDPEQMVRGSYAHRVLELTFSRLAERTGSRRVTPENLPEAERLLLDALEEERGEFRLSPNQTRVRAAVRRLEFDLLRYLAHEAERDGLFEPEHLELRFGFEGGEHPPVVLENGTRVRGVIDRVDTWNGWGLVRDYKSGQAASYKATDWVAQNRFQAALYMQAVETALGLDAAGGVYVPLGGKERRPRGMVSEELTEELGSDFFDSDRRPREELAEHAEWARAAVAEVAERMRSGQLSSCPESCAYRGGCSYPSICRVER